MSAAESASAAAAAPPPPEADGIATAPAKRRGRPRKSHIANAEREAAAAPVIARARKISSHELDIMIANEAELPPSTVKKVITALSEALSKVLHERKHTLNLGRFLTLRLRRVPARPARVKKIRDKDVACKAQAAHTKVIIRAGADFAKYVRDAEEAAGAAA